MKDPGDYLSDIEDRKLRIITLLYYAYEGYRSCTESLKEALIAGDEDTIAYTLDLQKQYKEAALKARRMLEE